MFGSICQVHRFYWTFLTEKFIQLKTTLDKTLKKRHCAKSIFWIYFCVFQVKTKLCMFSSQGWIINELLSVFRYQNKKNKQKLYRISEFCFLFFFFKICTENKYTSLLNRSGKNWMLCIMEFSTSVYFGSQWLL